jgi:hypothetical protein
MDDPLRLDFGATNNKGVQELISLVYINSGCPPSRAFREVDIPTVRTNGGVLYPPLSWSQVHSKFVILNEAKDRLFRAIPVDGLSCLEIRLAMSARYKSDVNKARSCMARHDTGTSQWN